jgi:hypothetical protein
MPWRNARLDRVRVYINLRITVDQEKDTGYNVNYLIHGNVLPEIPAKVRLPPRHRELSDVKLPRFGVKSGSDHFGRIKRRSAPMIRKRPAVAGRFLYSRRRYVAISHRSRIAHRIGFLADPVCDRFRTVER